MIQAIMTPEGDSWVACGLWVLKKRVTNNGFYIGCNQYLDRENLDYVVKVFNKILGSAIIK